MKKIELRKREIRSILAGLKMLHIGIHEGSTGSEIDSIRINIKKNGTADKLSVGEIGELIAVLGSKL